MTGVLYRKYRPTTFSQVVEQDHVKITLKNQLINNQVAHAYLLTGPRGVGKTTLARVLAKAINCQKLSAAGEPCGQCDNCQLLTDGHPVDLLEIDGASNRGINEIRELKELVKYPPQQLAKKVLIIDEVHMLTTEAFNALLKTLEEPPAHIMFVLATTEVHKLPETIISRCQRFDLRRISPAGIVKRLQELAKTEGFKVEAGVLQRIARQAEGALRDAEVLLAQVMALAEDKKVEAAQADLVLPRSAMGSVSELVGHLFKRDLTAALSLIQRLAEDGIAFEPFTRELLEYLRLALLIRGGLKVQDAAGLLDAPTQELLSQQVELVSYKQLSDLLAELINQLRIMRLAPLPQLSLELWCVRAWLILGGDGSAASANHQPPPIPARSSPSAAIKSSNQPAPLKAAAAPADGPALTVEQLYGQWEKILSRLGEYNRSLAAFLKVAKVIALENNHLTLGWRYAFQQEQANQERCQQLLHDMIKETVGLMVHIDHVLDEAYETRPTWPHLTPAPRLAADLGDISSLVETLGAQLVDTRA